MTLVTTVSSRCKAYGAGGIMRQPDRLHITWEDDYTCSVK